MATDRRILMLNSGMASKDVVEVSYQGLQVDYNEALTCSGLKLSGSTDQDYAYYSTTTARSKSEAGPGRCSNACSGKSTLRPTPPATNRGRHKGRRTRKNYAGGNNRGVTRARREGSTTSGKPATGLGPEDYQGERKMLYDLLEPGEDVELLHSCGFETKNVMWPPAMTGGRGRYRAPGNLAEPGRLSKNRFGLTYLEIDEITGTGTRQG